MIFSRFLSKPIHKRGTGEHYEKRALEYFLKKGWRLLDKNYTCHFGEIDLVLRDPKKIIVFMEVKYRTSLQYGSGLNAVDKNKQIRITKTAIQYIKLKKLKMCDFRFDVTAVTPQGIEHIPDAFSSPLHHSTL